LSANTQVAYIRAVRGLAKHYRRSPEVLTEAEVRSYLLHLRERALGAAAAPVLGELRRLGRRIATSAG
jgi:hypothetical protein